MSSGAGVVAAIVPSSTVAVRVVWVSSVVPSGIEPSTGITWDKGHANEEHCEGRVRTDYAP